MLNREFIDFDGMEDAFWDIVNEDPEIDLRKLMKQINRRISIVDENFIRNLFREFKEVSYYNLINRKVA